MAITSAVCNSFKTEVLQALHNFTASSGNSFKLALYTSSATLNKSTTAYSTSNEISNTSGSAYTAGGKALTSVTPALSTDTACCDFADISFTSALTYDFEVYSIAQEKWLEVSSVSNFESYQSNRLKLRFKDDDKKCEKIALSFLTSECSKYDGYLRMLRGMMRAQP